MKSGISELGMAAFYKEYDSQTILFENMITNLTKFKKYPKSLQQKRNTLIYLTFLQMLFSIFGMLYILFRRSFIYLLINMLTMILAICGVYGSATLKSIFLFIHCVFTTSITAAFFIFQLFDFALANDTAYGENKRVNDTLVLLIFSIPYVYDCFVGVYNYSMLRGISEQNQVNNELLGKDIENIKKNYSEEQIKNHIKEVDNMICIICMENQRNTVLYPCRHTLCCEACAKLLFDNKRLFSDINCPCCRKKCDKYDKIFL
jgi:hypothetical protein